MKKRLTDFLRTLITPAIVLCIVFVFVFSVSNLSNGKNAEDKKQLEDALTRAAVTCYAIEGAYPPSLEYLTENYGVRFNEELFTVKYELYASNLMPDIVVLEH